MPHIIGIIEAHDEVAAALEAVVTSANFSAVVAPSLEHLRAAGVTPAALLVRIAFEGLGDPTHAALATLPAKHPPIVALAWSAEEAAEAMRLKCDVVLQGPADVGRLCEALATACSLRASAGSE